MYRGYFRGCFAKAQDVWRKRFREGVRKRVRCVPYAYLAGMPKCGTTDLYTSLLLHENITAGCVKEPEWWAWKALGKIPNKHDVHQPNIGPRLGWCIVFARKTLTAIVER